MFWKKTSTNTGIDEEFTYGNGWLINLERLAQIAGDHRETYQNASPFPHIVLQDIVKSSCIENILQEFPSSHGSVKWHDREALLSPGNYASLKKKDSADFSLMGPVTRQLIWELNSRPFIQVLQRLTGIPRLISDPLAFGGGLHETLPGGLLKIHADFQKHPIYQLDRRLNIIFYLNNDWQEEYGGHLELWNDDMTQCEVRVPPNAGTCVVFNTNRTSYHGHPAPLTCPKNRSRRSIALYYYTNGLDDEKRKPEGVTHWQETPE